MEDKFTCIIVDDEPLARKLLTNYIEKTPQLKLLGAFKAANEVIEFVKDNQVDLLFSDIRMPNLSGIGLVENNSNLPSVVFTTAYEEYAVKAFELQVIDYLVKPFPIERFHQAVRRFEEFCAYRSRNENDPEHLVLKSSRGFVRIPHNQILYVEAQGEYMKVMLTDSLPELIYIRMKELDEKLGKDFIRIHKSFLVNIKKVDKQSGSSIFVGNEKLKVSRKYKPYVMKKLDK